MNYDQFYLKYRKIARIYAYGVLKDWNIADDVSQDVLYKMYIMKNDLNFENEKMLDAFIRRSAVNKALDYRKKASFRHEFSCQEEIASFLNCETYDDAETELIRREENEFMNMILEKFRAEQPMNYEILTQVKFAGISVETVAKEFGLTKSGVNNRIYKAKRWLKEQYRKIYE